MHELITSTMVVACLTIRFLGDMVRASIITRLMLELFKEGLPTYALLTILRRVEGLAFA